MNNHSESDKIIINFIYQCSENIKIETDINNKLETAINELCSRLNIDKISIFFLYNGNSLNPDDFDKSISSIISSNDMQINKMIILVYKIDPELIQSDDISIMLIIDSRNLYIYKGKKAQALKTIIQNENSENKLDLDNFEFIYRNYQINLDENFEDIADEYDKKINRLTIEANHKEKIIVKFVNDEFGDKRIICFPQDIIGNVIKYQCFAQITAMMSLPKIDIRFIYFFKYKNKEINFKKTINELYYDNINNKEPIDNTSINDTNVYSITPKNIIPHEIKEMEINIIKKTCCQQYKSSIIFGLVVVVSLICLIVGFIIKKSKD